MVKLKKCYKENHLRVWNQGKKFMKSWAYEMKKWKNLYEVFKKPGKKKYENDDIMGKIYAKTSCLQIIKNKRMKDKENASNSFFKEKNIKGDIIQPLYDKRFFEIFPNKNEVFEIYIIYTENKLLKKYGKYKKK